MDTQADSTHTNIAGSELSCDAKKIPSKKKKKTSCTLACLGQKQTLSSHDRCALQKWSLHTLSSHDSDADSEEDEIEVIEVIEKPEEEPREELGE